MLGLQKESFQWGSDHKQVRHMRDSIAAGVIRLGGLSVVSAVLVMMAFFVIEVLPLFLPAAFTEDKVYSRTGDGDSLLLAMDEYHDMALRITSTGNVIWFAAKTGEVVAMQQLGINPGVTITAVDRMSDSDGDVLLGLSDGGVLPLRYAFDVVYVDGQRQTHPVIRYPLGQTPIHMSDSPIMAVAGRVYGDNLVMAVALPGNIVQLKRFEKHRSPLSEEAVFLARDTKTLTLGFSPNWLLFDGMLNWLYVIDDTGLTSVVSLQGQEPSIDHTIHLLDGLSHGVEHRLTSVAFLLGDVSLLVAQDNGEVSQWFPIRDRDNHYRFERIRSFHSQTGMPVYIVSELRRKGFLVADDQGGVGIYHATAHRTLAVESVASGPIVTMALSPRSDAVLVEDAAGKMHLWQISNEHPEVSWEVLWQKVWYEGYAEPDYVWQSSAANNDFEPKFSLAPLAFGTIKAAAYTMLVAVPLALMGAIYTGFFMAPAMRSAVKPIIELLEALPTVIIGFLAGLWLAPFLEKHMPAFFLFVLMLPILVVLFAAAWQRSAKVMRRTKVAQGWEALWVMPVIFCAFLLAALLGDPVEIWLFNGDMPTWLSKVHGIDYDQRNALVVGIAMGLAVVPIIFSIAEDAIHAVPKHQINGSLALGATPWQTMLGVVLPTASPGLFSAVMIGLGRAVGETMIVLMATGNTPIMDTSMFDGLRTLAANIAVEMPESEVGSTHYRVLFLAALLLFVFTFVVNSFAESIRQRMLKRYSAL